MILIGGATEMTCTKCGKTFYDTSYNVNRICLKCQDSRELSEAEINKIRQLGANMVIYKIHYGRGKELKVTEEEAWEIYRYLEAKLTGFKRGNFKDGMRKKARSEKSGSEKFYECDSGC